MPYSLLTNRTEQGSELRWSVSIVEHLRERFPGTLGSHYRGRWCWSWLLLRERVLCRRGATNLGVWPALDSVYGRTLDGVRLTFVGCLRRAKAQGIVDGRDETLVALVKSWFCGYSAQVVLPLYCSGVGRRTGYQYGRVLARSIACFSLSSLPGSESSESSWPT